MNNPFRLTMSPAWCARIIERVLGLRMLIDDYDARPVPNDGDTPLQVTTRFLDYASDTLNYSMQLNDPDKLAEIPQEGPLIFFANHPFGGLEGIAMSRLLLKYRPDLKVLTNEVLTRFDEFSGLFIGVDVLGKQATRKNAAGMREVCQHLKQGGALLIYPAGQVSSISIAQKRIQDRNWSAMLGRLVRKYEADCIPFYVHGRNSKLFYTAGLIHPRLRTLLLPRELSNKTSAEFSLSQGDLVSYKEIKGLADDDLLTAYLRLTSDFLANRKKAASPRNDITSTAEKKPAIHAADNEPLQAADTGSIATTITEDFIFPEQELAPYLLLENKEFSVYCAPYQFLGDLKKELAVQRERTFRAAGEGTGQEEDIDEFDAHYRHLFIWDTAAKRLVGGYRVGHVDEIVERKGIFGLYSRSLYTFNESYLARLGNAIEVGRSFVALDYQRHPRALDLLWRGIGAHMMRYPNYHTLFGCVSISNEHSALAQAFLSDSMLEGFRAEQAYLTDVAPVAPLKVRGKIWTSDVLARINSIALINKLFGRCDPGKSIPVLLRHYLALNGRFVCFTVNKGFSDSLDGLIIVDLRKTPRKYLQRYFDKLRLDEILAHWNSFPSAGLPVLATSDSACNAASGGDSLAANARKAAKEQEHDHRSEAA